MQDINHANTSVSDIPPPPPPYSGLSSCSGPFLSPPSVREPDPHSPTEMEKGEGGGRMRLWPCQWLCVITSFSCSRAPRGAVSAPCHRVQDHCLLVLGRNPRLWRFSRAGSGLKMKQCCLLFFFVSNRGSSCVRNWRSFIRYKPKCLSFRWRQNRTQCYL